MRGKADNYTADQIEVLEGLEAVRRHPGMYIGGTDDRALHHLFAEILDNSIDEAVAGYATKIAVVMHDDGSVEVVDNGRGIPFDPHPKFKKKSALEVISRRCMRAASSAARLMKPAGAARCRELSGQCVVELDDC